MQNFKTWFLGANLGWQEIQPTGGSKIVSLDIGALARYRALVGMGERALENECQRCHCHPHWLPTEGAMLDFVFWGPILAVLQFPVFWWSRI